MKKYAEDREHCLKQQNAMVSNSYTLSAVYFYYFLWLLKIFCLGFLDSYQCLHGCVGLVFFVCLFLSQFVYL